MDHKSKLISAIHVTGKNVIVKYEVHGNKNPFYETMTKEQFETLKNK